jgi:hypothetical protein
MLGISLILSFSLLSINSPTQGSYASDLVLRRVRAFSEIQKAREALIPKAQELVNFLATTRGKNNDIGADDFTDADVNKYNPLILAVGSPSPQAFANAARKWQDYRDWWDKIGVKVPIITSTGRGRGYKTLVLNTSEFFKKKNKMGDEWVKRFLEDYEKDIQDAQTEDADTLMEEYRDSQNKSIMLTEAKVIMFILRAYGVTGEIILEENSNNTETNMKESYKRIYEEVLPKFVNQKKPLKIHVIADGFHRLRSLLEAIRVFNRGENENNRKEKWAINAQATYNPAQDSPTFAVMDEDDFTAYTEHMIGDPYGPVYDEAGKLLVHGEIGRILGRNLAEKAGYPSFRKEIESQWGQESTVNLRTNLLWRYLEAQGLGYRRQFNYEKFMPGIQDSLFEEIARTIHPADEDIQRRGALINKIKQDLKLVLSSIGKTRAQQMSEQEIRGEIFRMLKDNLPNVWTDLKNAWQEKTEVERNNALKLIGEIKGKPLDFDEALRLSVAGD